MIVDFLIIAANATNERMNGNTPEQLTGAKLCDVFPGLKLTDTFKLYVEVVETGEPVETQLFYDVDGFRDWFSLNIVRTSNTAIVASFRNLSEQIVTQNVRRQIITLSPTLSIAPQKFEQGIIDYLCEQLGFSHGFLSRIEGEDYHLRRLSGELGGLAAGDTLPLDTTICDLVLKRREVVSFNDIGAVCELHPALAGTPFGAYMGVPVYVDGHIYGALSLAKYDKRSSNFEDWQTEVLEEVASSIGHGIELQKLIATREEQTQKLERLNNNLREFTHIAAHDLRAPLRQAAAFTDLLKEELAETHSGLSEDGDEFIANIADSISHMQRLVRDLYSLTTVENKMVDVSQVDLNQLVDTALRNASVEINAASAEVEVGDLPTTNANAALFIQLFHNLVVNACKYADTSDLKLRIYARDAEKNDKIEIVVEDNGKGIPADEQDRVFQAFQRMHHNSEIEGTGIGLSFCRKIVELHHGKLTIDKLYTGGARFVIELQSEKNLS